MRRILQKAKYHSVGRGKVRVGRYTVVRDEMM